MDGRRRRLGADRRNGGRLIRARDARRNHRDGRTIAPPAELQPAPRYPERIAPRIGIDTQEAAALDRPRQGG